MDAMTRRVCVVAAAALAIVLLSAFGLQSAGTVPIHLDIAAMVTKAIYGVLTLIGGAIIWLVQQALSTLKSLDKKVTDAGQQLTTISHELFGTSGTNGMRSDVKEAKRLLQRHSKVLVVLADREGIDYTEDER